VTDSLLQRFRQVAFLEGVSFLVLLGIAMPLKYFADLPLAVRIVGMLHGVLFVAYVALVAALFFKRRWDFGKSAEAVVLSLLPFGTFVLERRIRAELASAAGPTE
jgi:integral membrane protein